MPPNGGAHSARHSGGRSGPTHHTHENTNNTQHARNRDSNNQRTPVLRIGTHNVRSMLARDRDEGGPGARALAHAAHWAKLKLDVVLVQETQVSEKETRAVTGYVQQALTGEQDRNSQGTWECYWSHVPESREGGGTAIFIRKALTQNGTVKVSTVYDTAAPALPADAPTREVRACQQARLIAVRIAWGGHTLQVASVYMPAGSDAAVQDMIRLRMQQLHQKALADQAIPIWGGDWNFISNASLDRMRVNYSGLSAAAPGIVTLAGDDPEQSTPVQRCLEEAFPELVDIYRHIHPDTRTYTCLSHRTHAYHTTVHASRIDRFFISKSLIPYAHQCDVPLRQTTSDHRVVVLTLLSRTRSHQQGKGFRRYRIRYGDHTDLRRSVDTWLEQQAAGMPPPDAPHDVVFEWWNTFKQRFAQQIVSANREANRRQQDDAGAHSQLAHRLERALAAVEQGQQGALHEWQAAEAQFMEELYARMLRKVKRTKYDWIQYAELPNPHTSRIMSPPKESMSMAALADPVCGRLCTDPKGMANIMAKFWERVSALPPDCSDEELAQVLNVVEAGGIKLPAGAAAAAGSDTITAREVMEAMKGVKPGRAPGLDGLPTEAYRQHRQHTAPMLAKLFTAIGTSGSLPADFHLGCLTFIHKSNDKTNPANYRPISLLGSDYRLLARILAKRLGPVMGASISREQSAFLPGRRIGEAIWFIQLLPDLLRKLGREAVIIFTDVAKAYDTVSRPFLFEVMRIMGAGEGLLKWARTLLSDTCAVALVNGHMSDVVEFHAGVRQGCPLSPVLYLFIAQASRNWMKGKGVGIDIPMAPGLPDQQPLTYKAVTVQYADDNNPLTTSLSKIVSFDRDMEPFNRVSNQHFQKPKTKVMRIGLLQEDVSPYLDTLPYELVDKHEVMGVLVSNTACTDRQMAEYWKPTIDTVTTCLEKITKLDLSLIGRAHAVNAYALSTMHHKAEYMGLPSNTQMEKLCKVMASVVDKGCMPRSTLTGMSRECMLGKPQHGGSGLQCIHAVTAARHAYWALQILTAPVVYANGADTPPPYVVVFRAIVAAVKPCATPLALLYACSAAGLTGLWAWPATARLAAALRAFPKPKQPDASIMPGLWMLNMPLWCNPFITDDNGATLEVNVGSYAWQYNAFATVGDIAASMHLSGTELHARVSVQSDVGRIRGRLPDRWIDSCRGLPHVEGPPAANPAAESPGAAPTAVGQPATWEAERRIIGLLRFQHEASNSMPLHKIRLRQLTAMHPDPSKEYREQRMLVFVREAGATARDDVAALQLVYGMLTRVTKMPWHNKYKEHMIRMCTDSERIHGHAKYDSANGQGDMCMCGHGRVTRMHCFWECPIARKVLDSLQAGMGSQAEPLQRAHCWGLETPAGVKPNVWQVVSTAGIAAILSARSFLAGRLLDQLARNNQRRTQAQPRTTQQARNGTRQPTEPLTQPAPSGQQRRFRPIIAQARRAPSQPLQQHTTRQPPPPLPPPTPPPPPTLPPAGTATQLHGQQQQQQQQQPQQQQRDRQQQPADGSPPDEDTTPRPIAAPALLDVACRVAAYHLHSMLKWFVEYHKHSCPPQWRKSSITASHHPFIQIFNRPIPDTQGEEDQQDGLGMKLAPSWAQLGVATTQA